MKYPELLPEAGLVGEENTPLLQSLLILANPGRWLEGGGGGKEGQEDGGSSSDSGRNTDCSELA